MRIKTQRETFAYRLADASTPFTIGDNPGGRGSGGGGGRGGGNKAEPSPAAPDANTPRGTLSGPWTSNPDKWNAMAEAEANRAGPKVEKRVIVPGAGGGSSAGGNSSSGVGTGYQRGNPDGSGILPGSRPLYDSLQKKFPGADIGGYRAPGDGFDEHARGALDFMTTDPDIAAQVRADAFAAGAPYVLWQQQQWNPDGSTSPMENRGDPTQNHFDHVHIAPI